MKMIVLTRRELIVFLFLLWVQSCVGMFQFWETNTVESVALAATFILIEVFIIGQVILFSLAFEWLNNFLDKKQRWFWMIFELLFGVYLVLFCLGFWTDLKMSQASSNKYYWFSIPLTAPVIGINLVLIKLKELSKRN